MPKKTKIEEPVVKPVEQKKLNIFEEDEEDK
jgi:hypothetical protein